MLLKVIIINWIAYEINLFLPIPEAGKSKMRVPADLESSEGVLLASETASFLQETILTGLKGPRALTWTLT